MNKGRVMVRVCGHAENSFVQFGRINFENKALRSDLFLPAKNGLVKFVQSSVTQRSPDCVELCGCLTGLGSS